MQNGTVPAPAGRHFSSRSTPLVVFFLVLSFLLSVAVISTRNTYDDEYSSLSYVTLSTPQIVHRANSEDVHPPGMYLLAHFAYRAIPSARWMTLFTLLLLDAGLAVFLFQLTPLFPSTASRVCFLLLASLDPQLLMWGNTTRWYGWWTGPALVAILIALRPSAEQDKPRFGYARAAVLGLLVAVLFYINYITLVFGAALALTMLFRYRLRPLRQYAVALAVAAILIYPQLYPMLHVHIPNGQGQRSGIALSAARLIEATLCSEAYLPWHPLAIAAALVFAFLVCAGVVRAFRLARTETAAAALLTPRLGLASIVLFSLVFFVLVAAAGFGVKPRNGLLLIPVLAVPFALVLGSLRAPWLRAGLLGLLAMWSGVGIEHLIARQGLTKSSMIERPEQVAAYVTQHEGQNCSVVVTYNWLLASTFAASDAPRLMLLSSWQNPVPPHLRPLDVSQCPSINLYRVHSYLGGMGEFGTRLDDEVRAAGNGLTVPGESLRFSLDPDAAAKRRLSFIGGATDLPDYRYLVTLNRIAPAALAEVESALHCFFPVNTMTATESTQALHQQLVQAHCPYVQASK